MSISETKGEPVDEGRAQTIFTRQAVWKMVETEFEAVGSNFPVPSGNVTEFAAGIIHTKSVELLAEKRGKFRALIDSYCPELIQAPHDLDALASALTIMEKSQTRSDVLISQSLQMVIARIRKLLAGESDEARVMHLTTATSDILSERRMGKIEFVTLWHDVKQKHVNAPEAQQLRNLGTDPATAIRVDAKDVDPSQDLATDILTLPSTISLQQCMELIDNALARSCKHLERFAEPLRQQSIALEEKMFDDLRREIRNYFSAQEFDHAERLPTTMSKQHMIMLWNRVRYVTQSNQKKDELFRQYKNIAPIASIPEILLKAAEDARRIVDLYPEEMSSQQCNTYLDDHLLALEKVANDIVNIESRFGKELLEIDANFINKMHEAVDAYFRNEHIEVKGIGIPITKERIISIYERHGKLIGNDPQMKAQLTSAYAGADATRVKEILEAVEQDWQTIKSEIPAEATIDVCDTTFRSLFGRQLKNLMHLQPINADLARFFAENLRRQMQETLKEVSVLSGVEQKKTHMPLETFDSFWTEFSQSMNAIKEEADALILPLKGKIKQRLASYAGNSRRKADMLREGVKGQKLTLALCLQTIENMRRESGDLQMRMGSGGAPAELVTLLRRNTDHSFDAWKGKVCAWFGERPESIERLPVTMPKAILEDFKNAAGSESGYGKSFPALCAEITQSNSSLLRGDKYLAMSKKGPAIEAGLEQGLSYERSQRFCDDRFAFDQELLNHFEQFDLKRIQILREQSLEYDRILRAKIQAWFANNNDLTNAKEGHPIAMSRATFLTLSAKYQVTHPVSLEYQRNMEQRTKEMPLALQKQLVDAGNAAEHLQESLPDHIYESALPAIHDLFAKSASAMTEPWRNHDPAIYAHLMRENDDSLATQMRAWQSWFSAEKERMANRKASAEFILAPVTMPKETLLHLWSDITQRLRNNPDWEEVAAALRDPALAGPVGAITGPIKQERDKLENALPENLIYAHCLAFINNHKALSKRAYVPMSDDLRNKAEEQDELVFAEVRSQVDGWFASGKENPALSKMPFAELERISHAVKLNQQINVPVGTLDKIMLLSQQKNLLSQEWVVSNRGTALSETECIASIRMLQDGDPINRANLLETGMEPEAIDATLEIWSKSAQQWEDAVSKWFAARKVSTTESPAHITIPYDTFNDMWTTIVQRMLTLKPKVDPILLSLDGTQRTQLQTLVSLSKHAIEEQRSILRSRKLTQQQCEAFITKMREECERLSERMAEASAPERLREMIISSQLECIAGYEYQIRAWFAEQKTAAAEQKENGPVRMTKADFMKIRDQAIQDNKVDVGTDRVTEKRALELPERVRHRMARLTSEFFKLQGEIPAEFTEQEFRAYHQRVKAAEERSIGPWQTYKSKFHGKLLAELEAIYGQTEREVLAWFAERQPEPEISGSVTIPRQEIFAVITEIAKNDMHIKNPRSSPQAIEAISRALRDFVQQAAEKGEVLPQEMNLETFLRHQGEISALFHTIIGNIVPALDPEDSDPLRTNLTRQHEECTRRVLAMFEERADMHLAIQDHCAVTGQVETSKPSSISRKAFDELMRRDIESTKMDFALTNLKEPTAEYHGWFKEYRRKRSALMQELPDSIDDYTVIEHHYNELAAAYRILMNQIAAFHAAPERERCLAALTERHKRIERTILAKFSLKNSPTERGILSRDQLWEIFSTECDLMTNFFKDFPGMRKQLLQSCPAQVSTIVDLATFGAAISIEARRNKFPYMSQIPALWKNFLGRVEFALQGKDSDLSPVLTLPKYEPTNELPHTVTKEWILQEILAADTWADEQVAGTTRKAHRVAPRHTSEFANELKNFIESGCPETLINVGELESIVYWVLGKVEAIDAMSPENVKVANQQIKQVNQQAYSAALTHIQHALDKGDTKEDIAWFEGIPPIQQYKSDCDGIKTIEICDDLSTFLNESVTGLLRKQRTHPQIAQLKASLHVECRKLRSALREFCNAHIGNTIERFGQLHGIHAYYWACVHALWTCTQEYEEKPGNSNLWEALQARVSQKSAPYFVSKLKELVPMARKYPPPAVIREPWSSKNHALEHPAQRYWFEMFSTMLVRQAAAFTERAMEEGISFPSKRKAEQSQTMLRSMFRMLEQTSNRAIRNSCEEGGKAGPRWDDLRDRVCTAIMDTAVPAQLPNPLGPIFISSVQEPLLDQWSHDTSSLIAYAQKASGNPTYSWETAITPLFADDAPTASTETEADIALAVQPFIDGVAQAVLHNIAGAVRKTDSGTEGASTLSSVSAKEFSIQWIPAIHASVRGAVLQYVSSQPRRGQALPDFLKLIFAPARQRLLFTRVCSAVEKTIVRSSGGKPSDKVLAAMHGSMPPIALDHAPLTLADLETNIMHELLGGTEDDRTALIPAERRTLEQLCRNTIVTGDLDGQLTGLNESLDTIAAEFNDAYHAGAPCRTAESLQDALREIAKSVLALKEDQASTVPLDARGREFPPHIRELSDLIDSNEAWVLGWSAPTKKSSLLNGYLQVILAWHENAEAFIEAFRLFGDERNYNEARIDAACVMRAQQIINVATAGTNGDSEEAENGDTNGDGEAAKPKRQRRAPTRIIVARIRALERYRRDQLRLLRVDGNPSDAHPIADSTHDLIETLMTLGGELHELELQNAGTGAVSRKTQIRKLQSELTKHKEHAASVQHELDDVTDVLGIDGPTAEEISEEIADALAEIQAWQQRLAEESTKRDEDIRSAETHESTARKSLQEHATKRGADAEMFTRLSDALDQASATVEKLRKQKTEAIRIDGPARLSALAKKLEQRVQGAGTKANVAATLISLDACLGKTATLIAAIEEREYYTQQDRDLRAMLLLIEEEIRNTAAQLEQFGSVESETVAEDGRLQMLREVQARIALALKKYTPRSS